MIDSQGGVSGGATIHEFVAQFAREGYKTHFRVSEGGAIECSQCHNVMPAETVTVRSMRRVEGASDPADMSVVSALVCPRCGARGTATFTYGVHAPPEHAEALRHLRQERKLQRVEGDNSLVLDTGWLDGPERG